MLTSSRLTNWGTNARKPVAIDVTGRDRNASNFVSPSPVPEATYWRDGSQEYRTFQSRDVRSTQGSWRIKEQVNRLTSEAARHLWTAFGREEKKLKELTWSVEAERAKELAEKRKTGILLTIPVLRKEIEGAIPVQIAKEYPNIPGRITSVSAEDIIQKTLNQEAMDLVESWLLEDTEIESDSWELLETELDRDRISERKLWHSDS